MKFDFNSADPEAEAREELLKHLEEKHSTMKPSEYLKYRRFKLSQFNTILQHIYDYHCGLISKKGGRHG